jgi:hypothetical protein
MLIRKYIQGHGIQSNNLVKISRALAIKKRKTWHILQKRSKKRRHFDFAWKIRGMYRDWIVSGVTFVVIIALRRLQTTIHRAHVSYNIKKALMSIRKTSIGFRQTS